MPDNSNNHKDTSMKEKKPNGNPTPERVDDPSQNKSRKTPFRTLGPVTNLEDHTRSNWWNQIFNSLYLKTDGDVVEDQGITKDEMNSFVKILDIQRDESVLDVCCGQGRHSLELARRGFLKVEGLDRSHYLIQRARNISRKQGLSLKFKEGDARKLPYPNDTFDKVMILGNSFGYFETKQDDEQVLKEVFRVLKPRGKVLLDLSDGEFLKKSFQPRSWEWIDKNHFVCRERSLSRDEQKLISREVITHVEKGVLADQFYSERLYNRESITELLQKSNFSDIQTHGMIKTESMRNQDLGMMEQRIILTAVVKKDWSPVKANKGQKLRHVTVLMGDPSKEDIIKPGANFDEDDFYTIDSLKAALRNLPNYQFSYLDSHDTLISDLTKLKGKTDYIFNLCDEGYMNDAKLELHIPAILEMLSIPYTGSNPQCLAYCYDKSLVRGIAQEMNIPTPRGKFVNPEDSTFELGFEFPVIIKPNFGDSSFGITQKSVCYNVEQVIAAIARIRDQFGYNKPILVEEFLTGADISVGILGNPPEDYYVLPIVEEDYSCLPPELPRIAGYEAKWDPTSPYWNLKSLPIQLPENIRQNLEEWCLKMVERLECRDYTRLDWRLDSQGIPRLLEVNPNPGWCWDGHLNKMAAHADMNYSQLLGRILESAERRLKLGEIGK